MGKPPIFISYRIDDTLDVADRLADYLRRTFGEQAVFFDRRTVEPGDPWDEDIESAVEAAQLVLVLIGKRWLTEQNEYGIRRLDLPEDWVRREVEEALRKEGRVIPVLVNGATVPPEQAFTTLPTLQPLPRRQAANLRTAEWDTDCATLVASLISKGIQPLPGDEEAIRRDATAGPALEIPPSYRDWIRHELADISLLGLEPKEGKRATLRQVYVPAMTQSPSREGEDQTQLVQLLARLDADSLYVAGTAGSGKTTFCKWLALLVATGQVPDQGVTTPDEFREAFPESLRGKLPVLCRLRDFYPKHDWKPQVERLGAAEMSRALARWVDSERPGGLDGSTFERFLAAGRVVLMLDGFDEVASSVAAGSGEAYPRAAILAGLGEALPGWQSAGNRVLLTARPYGLAAAEERSLGLPAAPLSPLPRKLQRLFVQRWYATVSEQPEAMSSGLWKELDGREDLASLRDNPMLLTAMCVKYQEGSRLPADVTEMYDALVSYVLHARYGKQSAKVDAARRRLGVIALAMHCGRYLDEKNAEPADDLLPGPTAEIRLDRLERALRDHNEAERLSKDRDFAALEVREDLLSNSGLLLPGGEQAAEFYHRSIQDYLAAERLDGIRANAERWLNRYARDPDWRQTFAFWFGRLLRPPGSPAGALRAMQTLGRELGVASLNGDPNPGLLWSDCLELAGAKLDDLGTYGEEFHGVCEEARAAVEDPAVRARLFAVLGGLGLDDRPGVGLDGRPGGGLGTEGVPDIAWVTVAPGRVELEDGQGAHDVAGFAIARYPVTWLQFEAFVQAGDGYADEDWWEGLERPAELRPPRWSWSNAPRVSVRWFEAVAFCRWLSAKRDKPIRLPTEEEWQLAATGGNPGNVYPWGRDYVDGHANCLDNTFYLGGPSPVGIYPLGDRDGIADLAGNVWEWTQTAVDFRNRRAEDGDYRVLRGGSWFNSRNSARSANRSRFNPNYRNYSFGFRVLCSSPID